MFRLALFIIFFTLVFTSLVGSIAESEFIILNISDYIIEINTLFASFLLILLIFFLLLITKLLYTLVDLPKNYRLRALEKGNDRLLEYTTIALSEMQLGNFTKAKTHINKLKKLQNNKILAHIIEAQAAILEKDDKLLEQVCERILKIDSKNSFALNGTGAIAFKKGNYKKSQNYLENAFANNKKGTNILPALIQSYFINNEQQKLETLLTEGLKRHLIKKADYTKEIALNAYLLSQSNYDDARYKKAGKYIKKAYETYPKYFPIFKLYITILIHNNKHSKARNLILKNWHLYARSELIALYENSSSATKPKKQLAELKKLIEQYKMDNFLPIAYAKIALADSNEKQHKEAEDIIERNQHTLEYAIGLDALIELKETLYGEHSRQVTELKERLLALNTQMQYQCSHCDQIILTETHICPSCLELASFEEKLTEPEAPKKFLN